MSALLLLIFALVLVGLLTWGAWYILGRMGTNPTLRWILTIMAFLVLLWIADNRVGIF